MKLASRLRHFVGARLYRARLSYQGWRDVILFFWRARTMTRLRVVVGSSGVYEHGWIPTEYEYLNLLEPRHWSRAFGRRKIDVILAEHVFEHLTEEQGRTAMKNCARFLRRGGYLRIAVPDGYSPDPDYIDRVKPGGWGEGSDDHKVLYNIDSLSRSMVAAGLRVRPLEYYDANGKFVFVDWEKSTGMVHRSRRFDERNADGALKYTSLILDGVLD